MKKFTVLAAGLLITACSAAEEADTVEAEEVSVEETASDPSSWASTEDAAGTFGLVYDDGTEGTLTLMADGSVEAVIGGEELTAVFTVPEPGKACYENLSTEQVAAQCWVNGPSNEDGSWTSTGDDGTIVIVSPME
ncbi:MAG: hypothetical protein O3C52_03150 [Proteobacteria bacterium]|nr:hypothetical protein [Pseudomonadota bacterium]MDA0913770.1 hypothetical protein [Pseudomonadota bacterium]MDA1032359.1 hypothetical protein [Pseudomonadota bacterium]